MKKGLNRHTAPRINKETRRPRDRETSEPVPCLPVSWPPSLLVSLSVPLSSPCHARSRTRPSQTRATVARPRKNQLSKFAQRMKRITTAQGSRKDNTKDDV